MAKYFFSEVAHFLFLFVIAIAIVLPIRQYVIQPFLVRGESMLPNFSDYDYLFVERLSYYQRNPQRGEVIVFRFPRDESEYFIKRVIAVPGDEVTIQDNMVTVTTSQGKEAVLNETYLPPEMITQGNVDIKLKSDEYFVLGDNRTHSYDSRHWGPVPKRDIIGKVFVRVWPPTKAQAFWSNQLQPIFN